MPWKKTLLTINIQNVAHDPFHRREIDELVVKRRDAHQQTLKAFPLKFQKSLLSILQKGGTIGLHIFKENSCPTKAGQETLDALIIEQRLSPTHMKGDSPQNPVYLLDQGFKVGVVNLLLQIRRGAVEAMAAFEGAAIVGDEAHGLGRKRPEIRQRILSFKSFFISAGNPFSHGMFEWWRLSQNQQKSITAKHRVSNAENREAFLGSAHLPRKQRKME